MGGYGGYFVNVAASRYLTPRKQYGAMMCFNSVIFGGIFVDLGVQIYQTPHGCIDHHNNATRSSLDTVVGKKWVKFQFGLNSLFKYFQDQRFQRAVSTPVR